jgi:hypothetical protein
MLDNINSVLNSGEVPNLYTTEERQEILSSVSKKRGMSIKSELERWEMFT